MVLFSLSTSSLCLSLCCTQQHSNILSTQTYKHTSLSNHDHSFEKLHVMKMMMWSTSLQFQLLYRQQQKKKRFPAILLKTTRWTHCNNLASLFEFTFIYCSILWLWWFLHHYCDCGNRFSPSKEIEPIVCYDNNSTFDYFFLFLLPCSSCPSSSFLQHLAKQSAPHAQPRWVPPLPPNGWSSAIGTV